MVKVIGILAISMSQAITATTKFKYPWMFGRRFDLFFYFAPIAFGITCYALSQSILADSSTLWLVLAVNAFGAGPFHQGPTWFAYLDKKNRSHYASTDRLKLIFYLGPVLVMAVTVLGWVYFRGIIYAITMAWAVQHIVQQNIGILLLYHNHGRGEALVEKKLESWSQWAPAIFFSTFFIHRILFQNADNLIFTGITAVTGVWALTMVARYILTLIKKSNEGEYINVPALLFWMVSVLSLAPFAFLGKSFDDAFVNRVIEHVLNEAAIDFKVINRDTFQIRKRTQAYTEVVQGKFKSPVSRFFYKLNCVRKVGNGCCFCNLETNSGRNDVIEIEKIFDVVKERFVTQG